LWFEKPTLAQHEIIDVAVAVFGRELAREIACPFKICAKAKFWLGHVGNSIRRYHAPARDGLLGADAFLWRCEEYR